MLTQPVWEETTRSTPTRRSTKPINWPCGLFHISWIMSVSDLYIMGHVVSSWYAYHRSYCLFWICEQYWTSPGGNTPQDTNYTATCLPSRKLSKLDEPDMQGRAHNWCTLMAPHIWPGKAGRPARTYIQQLCEDTGCSPEDLPEAMNNREKWREWVRDIRASGTRWWWWWHHRSYCTFWMFISCVTQVRIYWPITPPPKKRHLISLFWEMFLFSKKKK